MAGQSPITATQVQGFFKELNANIEIRERFYSKFKKLAPKDWQGFVNLGEEVGYKFTIDELKAALGNDFYTGRRAAWKLTVMDIGLPVITGTWVTMDKTNRTVVCTFNEISFFEEGKPAGNGKYKIENRIIIELIYKYVNHEENTKDRYTITKLDDNQMTWVAEDDDREIKFKRWPVNKVSEHPFVDQGSHIDDMIKTSLEGTWVPFEAPDDSQKYTFTKKTMTKIVDKERSSASLKLNEMPINYTVHAVEQIMEITTPENDIECLTIKEFTGDIMTLAGNEQELKLKKAEV